jgi:hypothetical protein
MMLALNAWPLHDGTCRTQRCKATGQYQLEYDLLTNVGVCRFVNGCYCAKHTWHRAKALASFQRLQLRSAEYDPGMQALLVAHGAA